MSAEQIRERRHIRQESMLGIDEKLIPSLMFLDAVTQEVLHDFAGNRDRTHGLIMGAIVFGAFLMNQCHCCAMPIRWFNSSYKGFIEKGGPGTQRGIGTISSTVVDVCYHVRLICEPTSVLKAPRPQVQLLSALTSDDSELKSVEKDDGYLIGKLAVIILLRLAVTLLEYLQYYPPSPIIESNKLEKKQESFIQRITN